MTHMITVQQVRTLSVNGRVSQHRTVSGKHIDAQTSIPGPRRSVGTHLHVLRRDIPEAREKGFIVTNIITVRQAHCRGGGVGCAIEVSPACIDVPEGP